MVTFKDFKKYFTKDFWKAFTHAFPLFEKITSSLKDDVVSSLYSEILKRSYYPSIPKKYLYVDKGNSVTRVVPVFEIKDYLLYYFCIKRLEPKIAVNRTENTFGGWSLGGQMRETEHQEIQLKLEDHKAIEEELAILGVSTGEYSFNPLAWSKWYGDFNSKLYATAKERQYGWVVEFDISNFYDCIRLDLLEVWVREIASKDLSEEVSLLFHFLNYWNRQVNAYNKQTVGIPQDAFGDCSRILANFYLQEYDAYVFELCKTSGCKYFRYADDQFIFGQDKEQLQFLLFSISKKLNCYGLNINQKKITYRTVKELIQNRSFEIFDEVRDAKSKDKYSVEKFLDRYFKLKKNDRIEKKGFSILKRALSCELGLVSLNRQKKLLKDLLTDSFLKQAKFLHLKKLYNLLSKSAKKQLISKLHALASATYHTAFHYELIKFLYSIKEDVRLVKKRINDLEKRTHNI